ncbi:MAG TPA: tripartite tricarboxylate transporter substrate binding protein [Xanthobacteraceae bacterium]|nr:tripartite tricarboxylate transporter substrate binding protein [Xanthobacteraceae bacterium]
MRRIGKLKGALLGFLIAGGVGLSSASAQQNYPNDNIHFISGYTVGSGADVIVRFFADRVSKLSGATVVVENKPGATGNIATEYVARSKPNGYTVLVHAGSGMAGNMHLYNSAVDVIKDVQLVGTINRQGTLLVVSSKSEHKTLPDLIKALKAKGEAKYGTSSTSGTITGEMFKKVAGLNVTLVNYRSNGDSLRDLDGGQIDYVMIDPLLALSQQRKGAIRILALSTPEAMKSLPGVPTFKSLGLDMDLTGWWAAGVAQGTPRPIVDKLNGWFNQILATDEAVKFLNDNGAEPFISSPDEAQKFLADSVKAWESYVEIAQLPKNK